MGAGVALLLLAPAAITFAVDSYVSRRQTAMLTARAVPYRPKPSRKYDAAMTAYCMVIAFLLLAMLGMAIFASFASFWPYNLTPSLRHYMLGLVDAEVGDAFINSLMMAAGTALFGAALVFFTAYLMERTLGLFGLCVFVLLFVLLLLVVSGFVF